MVKDSLTREDIALDIVRGVKYAMKIARGEAEPRDDMTEWLERLKKEAEELKNGDAGL